MNEESIKAILGEVSHGFVLAIAILTSALAKQLDPVRLANDIRAEANRAEQAGRLSPAAKASIGAMLNGLESGNPEARQTSH